MWIIILKDSKYYMVFQSAIKSDILVAIKVVIHFHHSNFKWFSYVSFLKRCWKNSCFYIQNLSLTSDAFVFACWPWHKRSLGPLPAAIFFIHLTITSPWSCWHTVCQTSVRFSSWVWQHQCLLCRFNIMPRDRKHGISCQRAHDKFYAKHVSICVFYVFFI